MARQKTLSSLPIIAEKQKRQLWSATAVGAIVVTAAAILISFPLTHYLQQENKVLVARATKKWDEARELRPKKAYTKAPPQ